MQEARQGSGSIAMPVVGLVVGVVLVLLGQFFLDSLADSSDTWHWIQHGVLFVGGIAIGWAAALLWASGQRRV
jgi:drug/metabolite transporter (DMT)-like permease